MERDVQITHIRAFVAVAKLGSFTAAAAQLGYTEPAVHLQVRALREKLGGAGLLEYRRGKMQLTALGNAILPFAEEVVGEVNRLVERASQHNSGERRTLRAAVGRGTASYSFPLIVSAFEEQYPGSQISFQPMAGQDIVTAVSDGLVDIGVAGSLGRFAKLRVGAGERCVVVPWLGTRMTLVGRRDWAATHAGSDRPVTIALPVYSNGYADVLSERLVEYGMAPTFSYFESAEGPKTLALAGAAAAALPAQAVVWELQMGHLVPILPGLDLPESTIQIMHRRPTTNPTLKLFVAFLRRARHSPAGWQDYLRGQRGRQSDGLVPVTTAVPAPSGSVGTREWRNGGRARGSSTPQSV